MIQKQHERPYKGRHLVSSRHLVYGKPPHTAPVLPVEISCNSKRIYVDFTSMTYNIIKGRPGGHIHLRVLCARFTSRSIVGLHFPMMFVQPDLGDLPNIGVRIRGFRLSTNFSHIAGRLADYQRLSAFIRSTL